MVALGVRAAIRGVVRKWEDVQVELHGSYSCARFKEMNKYSRSSGLLRALFVLVMTPVPVILLVAVVDALPLQPIELGLMHSGTLWLRGTLMTLFESFSILLVLRYDVAHLGISHRAMTFTSVATSLLNNAFGLGISALLWYPVPFILLWMAWTWIGLLTLFVWLFMRKAIRQNSKLVRRARRFSSVATSQLSTVIVYSVFSSILAHIPSAWQPVCAIFLPLFKLAQKNLLARQLKREDDAKPQSIVFNIEISNALFISSSVQTGVSLHTSFLLIAVDLMQLLVSIVDLQLMLAGVAKLSGKMGFNARQAISTSLEIAEKYPELEDRRVVETSFKAKVHLFRSKSRRGAIVSTGSYGSSKKLSSFKRLPSFASSRKIAPESQIGPTFLNVPQQNAPCRSVGALSTLERHLLLQKTLQILFLTEFMLLIEFMEVLVPVIHCECRSTTSILCFFVALTACVSCCCFNAAGCVLVITYYLPNRQFYAQLHHLDEAQLWSTISRILMYAALELLSFVMCALVIRHTTHQFPLQQLAFVLEREWMKVQPKIVIWVLLILQVMLPHSGTVVQASDCLQRPRTHSHGALCKQESTILSSSSGSTSSNEDVVLFWNTTNSISNSCLHASILLADALPLGLSAGHCLSPTF
jgi:hypothetical protein